jgi:Fe-S-cluster containining protein
MNEQKLESEPVATGRWQEVETARCSGACCRLVVVPIIHELGGLEAWKAYNAAGKVNAARRENGETFDVNHRQFQDADVIEDMLVDTGTDVDVDPLSGIKLREPQRAYACRHWDEATGNCGIHATRPAMCSEYPYGADTRGEACGSCRVAGCTRRTESKLVPFVDRDVPTVLARGGPREDDGGR